MPLAGERLYLDTNTIIGLIERSTPLEVGQRALMTEIGSHAIFAITSEIAVAECIVRPLRDRDVTLVEAYLRFIDGQLSHAPMQIDRQTILAAARLRADTAMKLPDAIHVACAQIAGCTVFVSADQRLHVPASMRRVSFDDIGSFP